MTDVKKVDVVNVKNTQAQSTTNPVEKEKAEKAKLNAEIQRELTTKDARKKAIEEAKQAYLSFGTVEGKKVESEKEAEKMAKNYVKDQQYKENSDATQVFMDKDAYDAAEKARKEKRKQLIEQYRNEGLSKKEAKQKADAQLPENEYLRKGLFGQKKTRKYIESHKDLFYDENGNFSSDKFKQTALKFANTHTEEGEAENHYLSLKERREVAEKENVKASVIKNIAKKSNLGYEKDNTNLYRGLYVAGVTGLGAGLGAAAGAAGFLSQTVVDTVNMTQTVVNNNHVIVKDENGNILVDQFDTDTQHQTKSEKIPHTNGLDAKRGAGWGAGLGLGIGLATMGFIKDRGGKEAKIYTPGEGKTPVPEPVPEKPPIDEPTPNPVIDDVPDTCPLTPGEEREEYCDYKVQKGEYWRGIVQSKYTHEDGSKLTPKEEIEVVHELKKRHGITDFTLNTQPSVMRLYTELNGKKYNVDCDAKVKVKATKPEDFKPQTKYTGKAQDGTVRYFYTDCNGNRSQFYKTKEERDAAMQKAEQAQKAA